MLRKLWRRGTRTFKRKQARTARSCSSSTQSCVPPCPTRTGRRPRSPNGTRRSMRARGPELHCTCVSALATRGHREHSAGSGRAQFGQHRAETELGQGGRSPREGRREPKCRTVAGVLQGFVRPFCTGYGHRERLQVNEQLTAAEKKERLAYSNCNDLASGSNMLARLRATSDSLLNAAVQSRRQKARIEELEKKLASEVVKVLAARLHGCLEGGLEGGGVGTLQGRCRVVASI